MSVITTYSINVRSELPAELYRMYDATGNLLYIGCGISALQRYLDGRNSPRRSEWIGEVDHLLIQRFDSRSEAQAAEVRAIAAEQPRYNKVGKKLAAA